VTIRATKKRKIDLDGTGSVVLETKYTCFYFFPSLRRLVVSKARMFSTTGTCLEPSTQKVLGKFLEAATNRASFQQTSNQPQARRRGRRAAPKTPRCSRLTLGTTTKKQNSAPVETRTRCLPPWAFARSRRKTTNKNKWKENTRGG